VQGHDHAAEYLADEQADQRPEHVAAQHHSQGAGDDRGDLQVAAEPQGELAEQPAMPLGLGYVINGTGFDQGLTSHEAFSSRRTTRPTALLLLFTVFPDSSGRPARPPHACRQWRAASSTAREMMIFCTSEVPSKIRRIRASRTK